MFIALLLISGALAIFAWIVFELAVYALPFSAGVTAASLAYAHGAGLVGAAGCGLAAGALVLAVGGTALAKVRSPPARLLTLSAYAVPAAVAGFAVTRHVAAWTMPSATWQTVFALAGGVGTAAIASARLTAIAPPDGLGGAGDRSDVSHASTVPIRR